MPHTIEITCYADLEELIASIVKLVGEISGKEVCQRNADDLRQAAVAIETMLAESAAIPPADYQTNNPQPHPCPPQLEGKMLVQDHGPRVDTRTDLCPVCGLKGRGWIERETTGGVGRANLTRIREYCNDPFHAAASQEAGSAAPKKEERR